MKRPRGSGFVAANGPNHRDATDSTDPIPEIHATIIVSRKQTFVQRRLRLSLATNVWSQSRSVRRGTPMDVGYHTPTSIPSGVT